MSGKKSSKIGRFRAFFAGFLVLIGIISGFSGLLAERPVYADPNDAVNIVENDAENDSDDSSNAENENENNAGTENQENEDENTEEGVDGCKESLGAIGWLVCPTTGKIAEAVDWLYDKIENILVIKPISTEDGTPVYEIWKFCLSFANSVFVIFLLVVVYSQITGIGISNYGIKKVLPKLIVMAIVVNLSFLICLLAVDISNILGNSVRGLFNSVEESALRSSSMEMGAVSFAGMYDALIAGSLLTIGGVAIAFEVGAIWMLIPTVLGAMVAVATGLITVALRQAIVLLLVMVSPLAIVASILPNTEKWYRKWKDMLIKMLVFFPMFSLLFGASSLAGFAIIMSAKDGFGLLLGMAVQVFPLFFAWKLMQMSGTILGNLNTKLRGLTAKPLAASRDLANTRRAETSARRMQYGRTPVARVRKMADNRRRLRAKNIQMLEGLRVNEAESYIQRKIGAGYDGTKSQGNEEFLKPNKYTRVAKDLANSGLEKEMRTLDTAHAIGNYGSYFVAKKTRERVEAAKKAKDDKTLRQIERTNAEYRRASIGGKNFLEYSRAQMTAENDSEADFNYMVSEFLDASMKYDPAKDEDGKFSKYKHYITSSAGGLGEMGQTRVLGKIIARAASVESNQRRDINIIANKFPPDKRSFRNMLVGYYVDDDGYATDKKGNRIEKIRGSLLEKKPDDLVLWDQTDENGPYFEWKDPNGNFVTKIYKKDKSAVKELLANFDAPINDPINNLYGVLAGVKEGSVKGKSENLKYVGLESYRTTIGRALLGFKEKNAAFSPMVKEMISKGYIQNYAQENLAYLDSLNKATKPGAFNVQDGDAIKLLADMMNPEKWEDMFPTEMIRGYRNVNGKQIYGIRYEANGDKVKVPAESASREELMNRVREKFIIPAAHKITMMMSKQTPNTADNQKAGTVEKWKELKEVLDTKWGKDGMIDDDPYRQEGDMRQIARDVQHSLYTVDSSGSRVSFGGTRASSGTTSGASKRTDAGSRMSSNPSMRVNHHVSLEEIHINSNSDPDEFARNFAEYCDGYAELSRVRHDFDQFVLDKGYEVTEQELYEFAVSLLDAYTNLD